MLKQIEKIKTEALKELGDINNPKDLEAWRVHYLGKKSPLTQILRGLATLSIEEKKEVGAAANQLKNLLEGHAEEKGQTLRETQLKSATQKNPSISVFLVDLTPLATSIPSPKQLKKFVISLSR